MARVTAHEGDSIRIPLANGDLITVDVYANGIKIRGSGDRLGKLAVEPGGANLMDVRVIA